MKNTVRTFAVVQLLLLFLVVAVAGVAQARVSGQGKRFAGGHITEVEFKEAAMRDAMRIIAEMSGTNIVVTDEAAERQLSIFLRDLSVEDAVDSICRVAGLWYRFNRKSGVCVVMTTEEYFEDIIVFREEAIRMFTLEYQNVVKIGRVIEAMFGGRVQLDLQNDFNDDLVLPGATMSQERSGSISSGSGRSRSKRSYSSSSGSGGRGSFDSEDVGPKDMKSMTTEQIVALEEVKRKQGVEEQGTLFLSEKTLASVRRSSRVSIFVSINREHNLLFVRTADTKALKEIEEIIEMSDRPTPQVLLEMKVMSITLEDGFRSAFDFSYTGGLERTGPSDGQPPNPYQPGDPTSPEAVMGFIRGVTDPGAFIFQLMNDNVRARLEILETEGKVNILATPLLMASNNRPAKIFIGRETVMTTGFEAESTSVVGDNIVVSTPIPETEVVEIGNTLTILPSINSDRTVLMRLLQEASSVIVDGARIPVVVGQAVTEVPIDVLQKSTLEVSAMAKDGLTIVVGGMISDVVSNQEEKVPLLGDIPLLGALFSKTTEKSKKEELVLLITPHVFFTPEEAEAVSRQRLGELSDHPNGLDIYLDKLDEARLGTEKGKTIMKEVAEASTPLTGSKMESPEEGYIDMSRLAARQVRIPFIQRTPEGGIVPIELSYTKALQVFNRKGLETLPVAEWKNGMKYIIAFKARNLTNESLVIRPTDIMGNWEAVTFEREELAPAGNAGDITYLYLISNKPLAGTILGK